MSPLEHELLRRIKAGLLRLRMAGPLPVVQYFHLGRRRWYDKKPHFHWKSGRAKYNFDSSTRRRLPVYRNRLVWMLVHQREIPEDCHVDHCNVNRYDDHPRNLCLMKKRTSFQQGNAIQEEKNFKELCEFFESVTR